MTVIDHLPGPGLRCIEASAGTGKTHRLSTLAARWLIESDDVAPTQLLVVTYTIAAARELRARIRSRLVEVRTLLAEPPASLPDDLAWCATAGSDAPEWIARADRALGAFDDISISTIHAFAASALGGSLRAVDTGDLRRRHVVAGVLATAAFDPDDALLSSARVASSTLAAAVSRALDNPDVALAPFDRAQASAAARAHVHAVERSIERFDELGRRDGVHTYADLITELHAGLVDDDAPLLATLRSRYTVGLIDEFQDTDPLQWAIFRRLFLDVPGRTLVVVGDPKQAIYGFRGADVDTYLAARALAESSSDPGGVESLSRNYRSDGALLRALNVLFDGATFDDDAAIEYVAVEPAPDAADRALEADSRPVAPLSIRIPTWGSFAAERQRAIAEDCAQAAADALGTTINTPGGTRGVTEGDVVVLCRARTQFPLLRAAFLRHGIRTTEAKTDDVLASVAALDVAIALRAMSEPTNEGAVLAVAHSWLGGPAGDDADPVGRARRRIVEWSEVLEQRGIASLARALTDPGATPGLLALPGGERLVTDLHHVFDVLADEAPHDASAVQLLEALDDLRTIEKAPDDELRTRRIDTDEPAVRLMTVHGAKGLEFPIVLCPFLQNFRAEPRPATMWRESTLGRRVLDASEGSKWIDEELDGATREDRDRCVASAEAGELRRLLYVALTRAEHRTVVWWESRSRRQGQHLDELTWLLLDRDADGRVTRRRRSERSDADADIYDVSGRAALDELRQQFAALLDSGDLELVDVGMPTPLRASEHADAPRHMANDGQGELDVAVLDRTLFQRAPRCSFSSLIAGRHEAASLDDVVGDSGADDEPADADRGSDETDEVPDPFGGARGTSFGSAVHEALEAAFRRRPGDRFDDALAVGLRVAARRNGLTFPATTLDGLLVAAATPVGDAPALRDLGVDDVTAELHFNLPVADGVGVGDLARCLLATGGAGPFAPWAERLVDDPEARPLSAALVGSIDLISTFGTKERFSVVDYKTNVSWQAGYGRSALVASMCDADYPLQALLYLVALHRLLRWRHPSYDPARHLGGAHYLYLRGMQPGSPDGIVSWSPGPTAVRAVSDLLAGAA